MRHVSVLERLCSLVVELRRIGPEDRQHDRELVEVHGGTRAILRSGAVPLRRTDCSYIPSAESGLPVSRSVFRPLST